MDQPESRACLLVFDEPSKLMEVLIHRICIVCTWSSISIILVEGNGNPPTPYRFLSRIQAQTAAAEYQQPDGGDLPV